MELAKYPNVMQLVGSDVTPLSGKIVRRAQSGKPRIHSMHTRKWHEIEVLHQVYEDQREILDAFYDAHKDDEFVFTSALDDRDYVCRFAGPFKPKGEQGDRLTRMVAKLIETRPVNPGDFGYLLKADEDWVHPAISYTRTDDKTAFNAERQLAIYGADIWPLEHDPVTGLALGRSVWPSGTNLFTHSGDLTHADWVKNRADIVAGSGAAPDGGTVQRVVDDLTPAASHNVQQSKSLTAGTTYTLSRWARYQGRNIQLQFASNFFSSGQAARARFNLQTGAVIETTGGAIARIVPASDGWYRCEMTVEVDLTASGALSLFLVSGTDTASYDGDGESGTDVFGNQFEVSAQASPYTQTSGSAESRGADSAIITDLSAIGFNPSEGTIVVEFATSPPTVSAAGTRTLWAFSDGTSNNRMRLHRLTGGGVTMQAINNGGGLQNQIITSVNGLIPLKAAVGYDAAGMYGAVNGSSVVSHAADMPLQNLTQFDIASMIGSQHFGGVVRSLVYVPHFSLAELQALSAL
jgi:hypothetical protein